MQRVAGAEEFLGLERVAAGGTAPDPEVVTELLTRRHRTPRDERKVAPLSGTRRFPIAFGRRRLKICRDLLSIE